MTPIDYSAIPVLAEDPTLSTVQTYVEKVSVARGQNKADVHARFLVLSERVGELAKALRIYEEVKVATNTAVVDMHGEIADVFLALTHLSNGLDVSMATAIRIKEDANRRRLWF